MVTEFFEDEYKRKWEEKKPILPEKSQHSPTNENIKRKRLRLK